MKKWRGLISIQSDIKMKAAVSSTKVYLSN